MIKKKETLLNSSLGGPIGVSQGQEFYRPKQVAELLGISMRTYYTMEKTPKTQATTTMKNITFDGMPGALASLHEKCDTIIALLSSIASGSSGTAMNTPIGMTEASKLLGKGPSTIYEMTSKRKIPFHKRGNKLYFFQDELLKWITDGGCSDTDYPDTDHTNIDDHKAEEHLKALQA